MYPPVWNRQNECSRSCLIRICFCCLFFWLVQFLSHMCVFVMKMENVFGVSHMNCAGLQNKAIWIKRAPLLFHFSSLHEKTEAEPEAVLRQLWCQVHPPLSLVSGLDQIEQRIWHFPSVGGLGVRDIQPTCHMCTLYLAQMAFGALQWRGVLDIQPTRHIHV